MNDPLLVGLIVGILSGLVIYGFLWVLLNKKTKLRKGTIGGITTVSGLVVSCGILVYAAGGFRGYKDIIVVMCIIIASYFIGDRYVEAAYERKKLKDSKKV